MCRTYVSSSLAIPKVPTNVIGLINRNREIVEKYAFRDTGYILGGFNDDQWRNREITYVLDSVSLHSLLSVAMSVTGMTPGILVKVIWIPYSTCFHISEIPIPAGQTLSLGY